MIALARHFLAAQNPGLTLGADCESALVKYSWPGNIRELRNTITKAALFAEGPQLRAADLALPRTGFSDALASMAASVSAAHDPSPSLDSSLDDMERRAILGILAQTKGHQKRAAEMLGISSRTLSRKLKTYALASV